MKKFNIRVYGILINSNNEVLVSDEKQNEFEYTKFPGGGLQWGEGLEESLKREFLEELNLEIKIDHLFYITDYFQVSDFNHNDQLISIYYKISCENWKEITTQNEKLFMENQENHRWVSLRKLNQNEITFPVDKIVVEKLKQIF